MRYTVFLVLSLTDKHKLLHFTTDEREFQICTYENHILRVSNIYVHFKRTKLESCDDSHKKDCTEQRVKKGEKKHERKEEIYQQRKEVHLFGGAC